MPILSTIVRNNPLPRALPVDRQEREEASPLKVAPEQAPEELTRIRIDTYFGMAISNAVALFIIVTTAATLNANGVTDIQTSSQAAEALRPIAGQFAFFVFCAWNYWHGLARFARTRRVVRLCVGRDTRLERGISQKAASGQSVLQHDCCADAGWRRPQFHPDRSDKDSVLERGDQWRSGCAGHGHDDASVGQARGNGRLSAADRAKNCRLACHCGHGRGCSWPLCDVVV